MMLSFRDDTVITNSKVTNPTTTVWFYLTFEFLIGALFSGFLTLLGIIKSALPKPPRDLTGEVVVVAGASSTLGQSLADEFAKSGCSVICIDNDLGSVEEVAARLATRYPRVEEIRPRHRKDDSQPPGPRIAAYKCDLLDREDIRETAKRIKGEMGRIDTLVTCVGHPNQDIFDTASRTLMSHYWTVLAFLPSMLHREKAHIIGITPVASDQDGYLGSRAALASLMESLGQELSNRSSHLMFLSISPVAGRSSTRQSEQQIARDVVQAVRRDQCSLTVSWISRVFYQISCVMYNAITTVTQWIQTQGCDYSI